MRKALIDDYYCHIWVPINRDDILPDILYDWLVEHDDGTEQWGQCKMGQNGQWLMMPKQPDATILQYLGTIQNHKQLEKRAGL